MLFEKVVDEIVKIRHHKNLYTMLGNDRYYEVVYLYKANNFNGVLKCHLETIRKMAKYLNVTPAFIVRIFWLDR